MIFHTSSFELIFSNELYISHTESQKPKFFAMYSISFIFMLWIYAFVYLYSFSHNVTVFINILYCWKNILQICYLIWIINILYMQMQIWALFFQKGTCKICGQWPWKKSWGCKQFLGLCFSRISINFYSKGWP